MYKKHFGLQRRPFLATVTGSDVFVGPQTAQTMAALRKALAIQDAVVAITGPAGCGKSTLVAKALEAIGNTHKAVRIGRMTLRGTDVLEFLLEELGVSAPPQGTIRQFSALREQLRNLESAGTRAVVVVEDARRLGSETLAELEALTAADAGESGGAALVIMGDEQLRDFLGDPQLARVGQRIRHRHQILPLSEPELRGYFMHSFRRAGGDFEQAFDAQSVHVIHELSGGIPRMANTIAEAAMSAAAATGALPVSAALIAQVAQEEFGLEVAVPSPQDTAAAGSDAAPDAEPEPLPELQEVHEPEAGSASEDDVQPLPGMALESQPEPATPTAPDPVIVFADEASDGIEDDIPELIQDTLPDLEVLAPEIMAAEAERVTDEAPESPPAAPESAPPMRPEPAAEQPPEPTPEPAPELQPGPETRPEPSLDIETQPAPVVEQPRQAEPGAVPELEPERETELALESAAADVPEWERDPTMAELMPDLEALEKAMAVAQGEADDGAPPALEDMPVLQPEPSAPAAPEEIPEITLDNAIQERVASHLIDEPDAVSAPAPQGSSASDGAGGSPEIKLPPKNAKKADAELERIAAELAKAKTIEDVDDKLAETLFGEELSLAAAEVAARVQAERSANDEDLELFDAGAAQMAQAAGSPVVDGVAGEPAEIEVSLESTPRATTAGRDPSASDRMRTIRALNSAAKPAVAEPPVTTPKPASEEAAAPASIEDQINTSMTQTLKALNVKPPISERVARDAEFDDEELEPKKNGFFSRFKRS